MVPEPVASVALQESQELEAVASVASMLLREYLII